MTSPPLTWRSDPAVRDLAAARIQRYTTEGRFTRGSYLSGIDHNWGVCLLGALVVEDLARERDLPLIQLTHVDWYQEVERLCGLSSRVTPIIDRIYEGRRDVLPGSLALSIVTTIPVGIDLAAVEAPLMVDLLTDPHRGALTLGGPHPLVTPAAEMYRDHLDQYGPVPVPERRRKLLDLVGMHADCVWWEPVSQDTGWWSWAHERFAHHLDRFAHHQKGS